MHTTLFRIHIKGYEHLPVLIKDFQSFFPSYPEIATQVFINPCQIPWCKPAISFRGICIWHKPFFLF